eukprot:TRINITY_DN1109_c0_g1_i1.p1 TRINITY_DN1109_c0_g1~~TRINITY_DN1109_c0_g1_i1.p1  ORF type:complete len:313 (-),score=26.10 TRINITY_DN1109_c0_g1_i1:85-1023(-)
MKPNDIVWQTVQTLAGRTAGLMIDGDLYAAGPEHDVATGRNLAMIDPSRSYDGLLVADRVLFPESLVPCDSNDECGSASTCRWYSEPTDTCATMSSPSVLKLPVGCRGLSTCQSCSIMGGACATDAECCGLTRCGQSGCCGAVGSSCDSGGECCSSTCGSNSQCCIPPEDDCTHSDECCQGKCIRDPSRFNHRICEPPPLAQLAGSCSQAGGSRISVLDGTNGNYLEICRASESSSDEASDVGNVFCSAAGCGAWMETFTTGSHSPSTPTWFYFSGFTCTVTDGMAQVRDDCMLAPGTISCSAVLRVRCNEP